MAAKYELKMAEARAFVIKEAPYFASSLYGFVYQPMPGIKTMLLTRKLVLGFDPDWAEHPRATVKVLAADLVHEINHFLRRHFERALPGMDPYLLNLAGDLAINPDLKKANWALDVTAVFPAHFGLPEGKSTEEYYDLLKQLQQQGKLQQPRATPGDGGSDAQGSVGNEGPGICSGQCGGIAGNPQGEAIEKELNDEPGLGRSDAEIIAIHARAIADIKHHAETKGRGHVPGNLLEFLNKLYEESFVRWQEELHNVLQNTTGRMQAGGDDFSRARPSKRSFMRGFPRPSLVEFLPEFTIIRDSSGSMGHKQLTAASREAYAIVTALGVDDVWFTDADTAVSEWKRVGAEFFANLNEAAGRGGTSFIKPLEEASQLNPRPDVIVYITDGDGYAPSEPPPGITVIWCIVPGHYNRAPADWGHCIIISDDPRKRNATIQRPSDDVDEDEEPL